MKLGRIFPDESHMQESEKRQFIKDSSYVARLGGHTPFIKKMEKQTDQLDQMVWIADGAKWIWNWIGSSYPDSIEVLDYFHFSEKLHAFAQEAFKDQQQRNEWTKKQEALLLESQANTVIENIEQFHCKGKAKQLQRTLLTYYENNTERMNYKSYREKGLLIGSGPMEAAHRHLVQARRNYLGKDGLLRVRKSNQWEKVINLINLN